MSVITVTIEDIDIEKFGQLDTIIRDTLRLAGIKANVLGDFR